MMTQGQMGKKLNDDNCVIAIMQIEQDVTYLLPEIETAIFGIDEKYIIITDKR